MAHYVVQPRASFYVKYGKRLLDIIISLVALIVTLPINLIVGIGTFFDVGSPIFFRQERLGKNGKAFTIIKFRNMTNDVDEKGKLLPPEMRVTKFGSLMRRTSLDELLNFWSILKGDMSVIGPRPLLLKYGALYNDRHRSRMAVRPGLECPTMGKVQSSGTWQERFENDIWYVENISLATDVRLFLRTVALVFDRDQTHVRESGGRGAFIGYDTQGVARSEEEGSSCRS